MTIGADGTLKCWGLPEMDGPHKPATPPALFGPIFEKEGVRYQASLDGRAIHLDAGDAGRPLREVATVDQLARLRMAAETAAPAASGAVDPTP